MSKKCQKIKFEIDRQNFLIAKLNREIEKKAQQGFPSSCLLQLQNQLCVECNKLKEMVDCAMKQENSEQLWGEIQLSMKSDHRKPPESPSSISDASAFTDMEFAEAVVNDNNYLEQDRCHLQEEILTKDDSIQDLEEKLEQMRCQLIKLCHDNKTMAEKLTKSADSGCKQEMKCQVKTITSNTEKLASNVKQLEVHLCELRHELCRLKKERQMALEMQEVRKEQKDSTAVHSEEDSESRRKTCPKNSGETLTELRLKQIQSQYLNLQMEFCRKEKECREMAERMKKTFESCKGDKEKCENEALKTRSDELVAEIEDYKVFIKELQEQVDTNREKFLKGKQTLIVKLS